MSIGGTRSGRSGSCFQQRLVGGIKAFSGIFKGGTSLRNGRGCIQERVVIVSGVEPIAKFRGEKRSAGSFVTRPRSRTIKIREEEERVCPRPVQQKWVQLLRQLERYGIRGEPIVGVQGVNKDAEAANWLGNEYNPNVETPP